MSNNYLNAKGAKGKQYLATGSKYYVADIGLRYLLLGTRHTDMEYILEATKQIANAIYDSGNYVVVFEQDLVEAEKKL